MHKRIGEKIRNDPSLLEIPRSNLKRWMEDSISHGSLPSLGLQEWTRILETSSLDRILRILEENSEECDRLRHSSPFPGILTEEERLECFHDGTVPA